MENHEEKISKRNRRESKENQKKKYSGGGFAAQSLRSKINKNYIGVKKKLRDAFLKINIQDKTKKVKGER